MKIYKDSRTLSGFRLEVPEALDYPFSHIGEYLLVKDVIIGLHAHETWEMVLQVEGVTSWTCAGRQIKLREGELLICPPGLKHEKSRPEAENYRFSFLGCKMDPAIWRDLRRHLPDRQVTTLPHAQELALNFRIAEEELLFERPRQREGVLLAWKQLWLAVHRLAASPGRPWNSEKKWLAQRVRTLLESKPGEPWTLRDMARLMGYAPNYFAALFKRESGFSFHQYLIGVRTEAAKKALVLGEETVTEIALKLGFSSSQHFSRVFSEKTGVVPSRWAVSTPRRAPRGSQS